MSLVIQLGMPIECAPLDLATLKAEYAKNENYFVEKNNFTVEDRDVLEKWMAQNSDNKIIITWPNAYAFISKRLTAGYSLYDIPTQWRTLGENCLAMFRQHRSQVTLQEDNQNIEKVPPLYKLVASQIIANDERVRQILAYLEASSLSKNKAKVVCLQTIEEVLSEFDDLNIKINNEKEYSNRLTQKCESIQDENKLLFEKVKRYNSIKEENELLLTQLNIVHDSLLESYEKQKKGDEQQYALTNSNILNKWLRVYASRYSAIAYSSSRRYKKLLKQQSELINNSEYFDASWYKNKYSDIANANVNPAEHYIKFGALEGRNPSPLFDTQFYLINHPDVAASGQNPLLHYLRNGIKEQRKIQGGHK